MSIHLINQYYNDVERLIKFSGTDNEQVITGEFGKLINHYCLKKGTLLVPQRTVNLDNGKSIRPDGVIRTALQQNIGFWESKANVDLEAEIDKKIRAKYPLTNTLFEDGKRAILYQKGEVYLRCNISEPEKLDSLLTAFVSVQSKEAENFKVAIELFKKNVPEIVRNLREMIEVQEHKNPDFKTAQNNFLALCRESINPDVTKENIHEMLIQHILTEEIFNSIFDNAQFHRENNIAKELYKVEETFFTGTTKAKTLNSIRGYYDVIKAQASQNIDYHSKQDFLKVMYEQFYKAYNPKGADKLGIVYTPNEIVKFMIESTNYLLNLHFNKSLSDKNVEILDPATGTGTFITELIENHIPKKDLEYKYLNEIHANEVSILPYYIANLNIEYIYQQKMKEYLPYPNICFVDTLDNLGFKAIGKTQNIFSVSAENSERINRQNKKKISVIIGNPPYNAKQENYNQDNANRYYEHIDKRIKETYIKQGTAQNQIVIYDMYTRFYRWAMDRIEDNGLIAFITNRSFIDGRAFDGFRKTIQTEFDFCFIYDTQSDVRVNPKIAGTTHNVFGIQTGVAIMFLIKKGKGSNKSCEIKYYTLKDEQTKTEKLETIGQTKFKEIDFEEIKEEKNNWINQTDNDFDSLIPLIDKEVKSGKTSKAIFKMFSSGLKSQRDEWVYDFSKEVLKKKMKFNIDTYSATLLNKNNPLKNSIKWDRELNKYLNRGVKKKFNSKQIISAAYRPFTNQYFYFDRHFNGMNYQWNDIYNVKIKNRFIAFNAIGSSKDFHCLSSVALIDLHYTGDSQCLPFLTFDKKGNAIENITDWGLEQFCNHYEALPKRVKQKASGTSWAFNPHTENEDVGKSYTDFSQPHLDSNEGQMLQDAGILEISKEDIFHYTYAVLHNPAYRKKYELNLKREFPRLPFYKDFERWARWGKALMDLHIDYETVAPFALVVENKPVKKEIKDIKVKVKLKADKDLGIIEIDEITTLKGIPKEAWAYKLGNRSALEWILDQYKEKKPSDPTIAEKFNTYRFADYKMQVIDLLMSVTTVSVETMKIIKAMERKQV